MEWLDSNFLTVLIAFPLIWACIGLLIPTATESGQNTLKVYSFVGSALLFALSLKLYFLFDSAGPEFQAVERSEWIPLLGIQYHVGIDGLSLWLVLLTTALMPIVLLGSFHAVEMRHREYYFLLMALETGMIGAFVSLDVFLFYVFWELMLIPMYFLIGIWGSFGSAASTGGARRRSCPISGKSADWPCRSTSSKRRALTRKLRKLRAGGGHTRTSVWSLSAPRSWSAMSAAGCTR
jgi:NADH:ubiquinone oxidoreductase subunit 4 (subunit M)